jgi:AcrR family transcriptional regulator
VSTRKKPAPKLVTAPGKRERTRRLLLNAAVKVFATKSIEAASIQEIAAVAGVANGTFYNYFQTKEELVEASAVQIGIDFCERIDASIPHVTDGAERMSIGGRRYMVLAIEEPELARFMMSVAIFSPAWAAQIEPYIRRDLMLGIKQKRFHVASIPAAMDLITGANFAGIGSVLAGRAGKSHVAAISASILRGLGMSPKEADEIAKRPLPPLPPSIAE